MARYAGLTLSLLGCSVRFITLPKVSETKEAIMFKRAIWVFAIAVCIVAPVTVHAQGDYLDVYIVKVKPEKLADFQALSRKWVDANRRFNGDHWVASETIYGEGDVFVFASPRQDYADIDKLNEAGTQAVNRACGKESRAKILRDWESCLVWSRTELRHRRPDLSRKVPTDMDSYAKLIGESKVLRTTAVHVRPGHTAAFEALLKEAKEAGEKAANTQPVLVSQVVEGGQGATFYVTTLRSSLGGFDKNPTLREILGEERFKKYLQMNAESVESSESALYRFSPELSNPSEEIVKVAADFWHPKAMMAGAAAASQKYQQNAGPTVRGAATPGGKPHWRPEKPGPEGGSPGETPMIIPPI